MTTFTTPQGEKIDFTSLGAGYTASRLNEALESADLMIGAALQKDMSRDVRDTLLGVRRQVVIARAARAAL